MGERIMLIFFLINDMLCKIIYIDMDVFFVFVEECDNFFFKGKFVIIGFDFRKIGGRGVVFICNYEVWKFGVYLVMFLKEVYEWCF